MKNFIGILCAALVLFSSCGEKGYKIEAQIEGLEDGWVYLSSADKNSLNKIDSVEAVAGAFILTGSVDMPEVRYIQLSEREYIPFFIENSDIKVTGLRDSISNVTILGSATNDIFQEFLKKVNEWAKESQELQSRYMQAQMKGDQEAMKDVQIDAEGNY